MRMTSTGKTIIGRLATNHIEACDCILTSMDPRHSERLAIFVLHDQKCCAYLFSGKCFDVPVRAFSTRQITRAHLLLGEVAFVYAMWKVREETLRVRLARTRRWLSSPRHAEVALWVNILSEIRLRR
jgi:hypothetical protein